MSRRVLAVLLILSFAASACSARPDAKASTDDSTGAGNVSAKKSPADIEAELERARGSAKGTETAKLIAGRNAHDSVSFYSAIRAGTRALANWPKGPDPLPGAILPHKRIVAFYGNPLSKRMGVLGEYPVDEMLKKLDAEVARWRAADPTLPVQPALHLVSVVAQGAPGRDGMYRLRMDTALINTVYGWAQQKDAILFLDIQVGRSTLQAELPRLLPFLARPNVHLAIDPEFSMHYDKEGLSPGRKIGTMDAADVNYAISTLSQLVREKNLPPKILIVHRFTRRMVTNAS